MNVIFSDIIKEMQNIQECFLNFINEVELSDEKFQEIKQTIENLIKANDSQKIKLILHLISKISNNTYRSEHFFDQIEKILSLLTDTIINMFSNFSIFNIVKNNKRILLYFIEKKVITIDESIAKIITSSKYQRYKYDIYFFPEIQNFISEQHKNKLIDWFKENPIDDFEKRRKDGENDSYICSLIRNDSIDDFIIYVNQINYSLSGYVPDSIFETNSYLFKYRANLIQYAAFFGSIQIFKYLLNNSISVDEQIFPYAAHSNSGELINSIEEMEIYPKVDTYLSMAINSMKCYHNEIAEYFISYFDLEENLKNIYRKSLEYYNFQIMKPEIINNANLSYLCRYDYYYFVNLLLKNDNLDINIQSKILKFIFVI